MESKQVLKESYSHQRLYDTLFVASLMSLIDEADPEKFVTEFEYDSHDIMCVIHTLGVWLNTVGFMVVNPETDGDK